jgi:hypothetical protein
MGSLTVVCPAEDCLDGAVLTGLVNPCPADVGQIQKLIFWRAGNSISTITSSVDETYWGTLVVATGDTKAVVTPYVNNPDIPAGDAREFGGGNETRWGAPLRKGGQSPVLTFNMLGEDQDVISEMKSWRGEAMEVLFINEANQLIYSDASTCSGFPIVPNSFFVGDKKMGGLEDWDSNVLQFNLQPNWSDTLEISTATSFLLSLVNNA